MPGLRSLWICGKIQRNCCRKPVLGQVDKQVTARGLLQAHRHALIDRLEHDAAARDIYQGPQPPQCLHTEEDGDPWRLQTVHAQVQQPATESLGDLEVAQGLLDLAVPESEAPGLLRKDPHSLTRSPLIAQADQGGNGFHTTYCFSGTQIKKGFSFSGRGKSSVDLVRRQ